MKTNGKVASIRGVTGGSGCWASGRLRCVPRRSVSGIPALGSRSASERADMATTAAVLPGLSRRDARSRRGGATRSLCCARHRSMGLARFTGRRSCMDHGSMAGIDLTATTVVEAGRTARQAEESKGPGRSRDCSRTLGFRAFRPWALCIRSRFDGVIDRSPGLLAGTRVSHCVLGVSDTLVDRLTRPLGRSLLRFTAGERNDHAEHQGGKKGKQVLWSLVQWRTPLKVADKTMCVKPVFGQVGFANENERFE